MATGQIRRLCDERRRVTLASSRLARLSIAAVVLAAHAQAAQTTSDGQTPTPKPAEPPPAVTLVEGQVVNYVGAGELDVKITVALKNPDGSTGPVVAEATTRELGDFAVTGPATIRGAAVVTLSKAGFTTATRDVVIGGEDGVPFIDLEMQGNLPLVGKVIDGRDQKPVQGAAVTAKAVYREWKATSGEDGAFTIVGVPPGAAELIVEADGFGRETRDVEHVENFGEITITIKPERVVHIRTVDVAQKPVAGATVECLDAPRQDYRTVITDSEGKVTLRGVHYDAAEIQVRLSHRDYVSSTQFDRVIATSPDSIETTETFVLEPAGRIVGKVIDAESRDGLGGARISVGSEASDSDANPIDFSGLDGSYTINGVPPGRAAVTVHRSGRAPDLQFLEVKKGEEVRLEIKLRSPRTIKGVVVDSEGKPSPGAFIMSTDWREHETLGLRAMCDDQGRFELHDAPWDAFGLKAMASDRTQGEHTVPDDDVAEVKVVLKAGPTRADRNAVAVNAGAAAPAFTFTTLQGVDLSLADLKGSYVLLDFWATWCGPCIGEVPHLLEVHKEFGQRKNFVMISVSLDQSESDLRKFINARAMTWHHVFGERNGVQSAADAYGVVGIPALFLIGPDGKIIATHLRGGAIRKEVAAAMEQADPT